MAANLHFQEYDNALSIRATTQPSPLDVFFSTVTAGGFAAIAISTAARALGFPTSPALLPAVAVAAAAGFFKGKCSTATELRVTNLEYASRTHGGLSLQHGGSIPRVDVRWLEYHEGTGGPDGGAVSGLYAVLRRHSICILPGLSAEQTTEVIERIATTFPSFREQWASETAFGTSFTTLGLDRTGSNR